MTKEPGNILDLPDEEIIKIYIEQMGMTEEKARMLLAMQRGQMGPDGDVVMGNEDGS